MSVRVRIAPSPTGDPHVGTAYIALFNYCFARKHGGQFLLRIEDTDRTRSTRESEAAIMAALKWLGLSWDEGPYRQSERSEIYQEHARILLENGGAYRCYCTPERLAELREEQKRQKAKSFGYDGRCRDLPPGQQQGDAFTVRLRMPREGHTVFQDRLRGRVEIDNAQVDDQVLLKSDGFPTYHLANVVDDHLMKISHVIRAEEWISSTPKHVVLYQAFGWAEPEWIHMPLLRNADKSKISKRKNPVSIDYYRDAGVLPEALLNFLGLMGWSFGGDREKFTLAEMIGEFTFDRVSLGGPVFDLEKLSWLNGLYLRDLGPARLIERMRGWRLSDDYLVKVATLLGERIRRLDEFMVAADFFFVGDLDYRGVADDLVPKGRTPKETGKLLGDLLEQLEGLRSGWTAAATEPLARELADKAQWKTKELFMTLRLAVTGKAASPPLFETMEVLGKEIVRRRLRSAADFLAGLKRP